LKQIKKETTHLLDAVKIELAKESNSSWRITSNKQTKSKSLIEDMYELSIGLCNSRNIDLSTREKFYKFLTKFHESKTSLKTSIQKFIVDSSNKNNEVQHIYEQHMIDAEFISYYGNISQIDIFNLYSTVEFWCDLMFTVIKTAVNEI
jgi:hypothetical protein